jgi:hypothetical protein
MTTHPDPSGPERSPLILSTAVECYEKAYRLELNEGEGRRFGRLWNTWEGREGGVSLQHRR